jgi:sugar phosphate isomerase/epimerase
MAEKKHPDGQDRRSFLKQIAIYGGGLALVGSATSFDEEALWGAATPKWGNQIGLELFTVRDLMTDPKSYQSTLEKVAAIGYKEIEPAGGYGGLEPKDYRALLDRLGLSMPSTHSGATEGPDLETQLEGFQIMGIQYAGIGSGAGRGGAGRRGTGGAPGGGVPAGGAPYVPPPGQLQTEEAVKHTAAEYNRHGEMAKKFGIKMLIHNHTIEFAPLSDNADKRPYDILLAETDPSLVAMQMDIGWAALAGQDIVGMFKKNPGRYELWHVKDALTSKMDPNEPETERMGTVIKEELIKPVGQGDIDYKKIFANAKLAGLKHFCVEQDNAADNGGDSLAACKISYESLRKMLS